MPTTASLSASSAEEALAPDTAPNAKNDALKFHCSSFIFTLNRQIQGRTHEQVGLTFRGWDLHTEILYGKCMRLTTDHDINPCCKAYGDKLMATYLKLAADSKEKQKKRRTKRKNANEKKKKVATSAHDNSKSQDQDQEA